MLLRHARSACEKPVRKLSRAELRRFPPPRGRFERSNGGRTAVTCAAVATRRVLRASAARHWRRGAAPAPAGSGLQFLAPWPARLRARAARPPTTGRRRGFRTCTPALARRSRSENPRASRDARGAGGWREARDRHGRTPTWPSGPPIRWAAKRADRTRRARWMRRVSSLAERARSKIADHPSIVPLLLTQRHSAGASLRWGEAMLSALSDGGFAGKRRALAFRTLCSYVLGAVQMEHFGALAGSGTATMAELPRAEFPQLAETARHARRISQADEFESGLAVVLRGLRALGDQRSRRE